MKPVPKINRGHKAPLSRAEKHALAYLLRKAKAVANCPREPDGSHRNTVVFLRKAEDLAEAGERFFAVRKLIREVNADPAAVRARLVAMAAAHAATTATAA
jgi:hypothetical protein